MGHAPPQNTPSPTPEITPSPRTLTEILHEAIVIEELTASPPQVWDRILQRWRVLGPHAGRNDLTKREVDSIAEAAQISRRQVYADLRKYRDYSSGSPVKIPMTGVHYHICKRQEEVIAESIRNMGHSAKFHEIIKEVGRVCARDQVSIPSATAIGTRFDKIGEGVNLKHRLMTKCDAVADICGLPLDSYDDKGTVRPLHLLTVINTQTGAVLSYRLSVGPPSPREVQNLISTYTEETPALVGLLFTRAFLSSAEIIAEVLPSGMAPDFSRRIRAGRAIKAALGARLGRIRLRIDPTTWGYESELPPVDFSIAHATISRLLSQKKA